MKRARPRRVHTSSQKHAPFLEQPTPHVARRSVDALVPVVSTSPAQLLRLSTASNCCYQGAGVPQSGIFRFFDQIVVCYVFFFCQVIVIRCVCRRHATLQIGTTHEHTVRCQICCLSRKRGVIVDVSGPSMVSVVIRCLFVVRFWLADVGWGVRSSSTWSVLLSVVLGRGILCGPLKHWGAGRLIHRGIRIRAAASSCAHVSCSGGREPVARVQMQLTSNRHFGVLSKQARSCATVEGLNKLNRIL